MGRCIFDPLRYQYRKTGPTIFDLLHASAMRKAWRSWRSGARGGANCSEGGFWPRVVRQLGLLGYDSRSCAEGVTCADFAEVCVQTEARNGAAVAAPVCCHCLGFPVFGLYKVNGLGLLGQRVLGWG
ncbi:hypothetical protein GOBAR_DD11086 [Gossypium barbadense]|nr:hypothetical protein GOBAR_DD11086 [Gossypium barbadense]